MNFTYLLDTSVLSQPLRESPLRGVQRRWTAERAQQFCTSVICQAELLRGLEARNSAKLWRRYHDYLAGEIAVMPFDEAAAEVYARLWAKSQREGSRRDMADLLVAAAASAAQLILVTLNPRHFANLEDVRVEDWSR